MSRQIQPVYLMADSEMLFWKRGPQFLLEKALASLPKTKADLKAAYIGASNGDQPAYYDIFLYAMEQVSITACRMITSRFTKADRDFLKRADVLLLSGGEVKRGWKTFQKTGLDKYILDRYFEGAIVVGVSAGSIQAGLYGWDNKGSVFKTLKMVPFVIDVHDEKEDWARLKKVIHLIPTAITAIGIPRRGGLVYHPDQTLEALRKPLTEFSIVEGAVRENLIFPQEL